MNCNLTSLTFLLKIKSVYSIKFENSSNLYEVFNTLPTEFEASVLIVTKSRNLDKIDELSKLPEIVNGLTELRIHENEDINDATVSLLLDWLVDTEIRNHLRILYLFNNELTKIPTQIWRFSQLQNFRFENNNLSDGILKQGDLKFSSLPQIIYIYACGIQKIEPGAFQG